MNIIGINVSHNASACLMMNGKIVIATQEERFTKMKNFCGYPKQSIDYCLKYLQERNESVDKVAFSTVDLSAFWFAYPIQHYFKMNDYHRHYGNSFYGKKLRQEDVTDYYNELVRNAEKNKAPLYLSYEKMGNLDSLLNNKTLFRELQSSYAAEQCGITADKVQFIDHHTCHAYYAFHGSKRKSEECAVITLDSDGDGYNQTVWHFKNGIGEKLRGTYQCDLGRIYKITTLLLGMKPDEHEFKVMGMAPYAKPEYVDVVYNDVYRDLLKVEDSLVLHNNRPLDIYDYLEVKLKPYRFDNIAGAVQKLVEEVAIKLFKQVNQLTGLKHFCVSGGVSMNIKMNMILSQLDFVEGLYVPASGADESLCMGACYVLDSENAIPLNNTYLGTDIRDGFSDVKIKTLFLDKDYEVSSNVSHSEIATILANGNVIAQVRGREEFGARALGNRSIIASPNDPEVVKIINEAIKNRDFWMPFALSILADKTSGYIDNPKNIESPSMTIGFETFDNEQYKKIKAGTHPYDRTCRPQILKKEANPEYYDIINEFFKLTGIPALLNTSLNLHGDPICSTIDDVEYTFSNSGLMYLYINDSILVKKRKVI
jgi:carbamoyltransferase